MLYTAIDTFYLTKEELFNSPSRRDGIDEETERQLRFYGCELIQEAAILLKLPQAVAATGQVLFHRFYCRKSMKKFNVKRMAATCTWLAAKLEECPKRPHQLLAVFDRMWARREGRTAKGVLDCNSKEYEEMKDHLIKYERYLLRAFGFIAHVDHPHKFLLSTLNQILRQEEDSPLMQECWNLVNDSLRTTLCVRFKSETVTCGVIFMAARRLKLPMPESPPWWEAFSVKRSDMFEVCRVLCDLYRMPKAEYISVSPEPQPAPQACVTIDPSPDSHESPGRAEAAANGYNADNAAANGTEQKMSASGEAAPTETVHCMGPTIAIGDDLLSKDNNGKEQDMDLTEKDDKQPIDGDKRISKHDRGKDRDRDGDRSHKSYRDRDRDATREREREKGRDRERERPRDREKDRDKGRDATRDKDRDGYRSKDRDKEREKDRRRDRERDREKERKPYRDSKDVAREGKETGWSKRDSRELDRSDVDRHLSKEREPAWDKLRNADDEDTRCLVVERELERSKRDRDPTREREPAWDKPRVADDEDPRRPVSKRDKEPTREVERDAERLTLPKKPRWSPPPNKPDNMNGSPELDPMPRGGSSLDD